MPLPRVPDALGADDAARLLGEPDRLDALRDLLAAAQARERDRRLSQRLAKQLRQQGPQHGQVRGHDDQLEQDEQDQVA